MKAYFHLISIVVCLFIVAVSAFNDRPLENQTLTCCSALQFPIVYKDKKHKPYGLSGLGIDYLQELQKRLGFRCGKIHVYNGTDVSFTQFVYDMEACSNGTLQSHLPICKCQLGVGGWMQLSERDGRVRFIPPFSSGEVLVLTHVHHTSSGHRGVFFMAAFEATVWDLIFLLLATFTILIMLDRRFVPCCVDQVPPPPLENTTWFQSFNSAMLKFRFIRRLRLAVMTAIEILLGRGSTKDHLQGNSTRQWLLRITMVLCGLFFTLSYEATLTAILVQEEIRAEFRTIEDIRQCRIDIADVCVPKGGAIESFFKSAVGSVPCHNGLQPRMFNSYDLALKAVAEKKCKFLISDDLMAGDATNRRYCNLVRVGERLHWGGSSFIMPKNSRYYDVFSKTTLDLREEGRLQSVDNFFRERGSCTPVYGYTLNLERLKSFFIVAFSLCGIFFILMVLYPQSPPQPVEPPENECEAVATGKKGDDTDSISTREQ